MNTVHESKTIYVVTSGSYSDYTISGVFSTKEGADRYISESSKHCYSEDRVEEFQLDSESEKIMRTVWWAYCSVPTGEVVACYCSKGMANKNHRVDDWDGDSIDNQKANVLACSYVSEEHAIKVAVERRQEVLRRRAYAENLER